MAAEAVMLRLVDIIEAIERVRAPVGDMPFEAFEQGSAVIQE
jgi:uncharacterized protein with HEPN domain